MKRNKAWFGLAVVLALGSLIARAQEYDCPEGQEYGPDPGDPYPCVDGWVYNPGHLSPISAVVCVGATVSAPQVVDYDITSGMLCQNWTYRCEENQQYNYTTYYGPFDYTPSVRWSPPIPTNALTQCGTYSYDAYLKGVSPYGETEEVLVGTFWVMVVGVADLTPTLPSGQGGLESGSDPPTYWVCPCDSGGHIFVTASSCPSLDADKLPDCWTFTGGDTIDKLQHKVSMAALLNGPVTFTVSAGTSTKTIILKADPPNLYYVAQVPTAVCPCYYGSGPDPDPFYDWCRNRVEVPCVSPGWLYCNQYQFQYNGSVVGPCIYPHGQNVFLYRTTKHNCRIIATWHLTREPATGSTPHTWTITKHNILDGTSSAICRTNPTWSDNWARPADEVPPTPINAENQGTLCP